MSLYIGLMSGTSLDGVDGVLLSLAEARPKVLHACHLGMPETLRHTFLALNTSGPDELHHSALAANALSQLYAQATHSLLQTAGLSAAHISAIGAHGQTVRHQPGAPGRTATTHTPWLAYTLQLNNPALLAELTGIAVVADFRSRDVAAGGQGAPLVPAFHRAVFAEPGKNVAVANVGGMANVTLIDAHGHTSGFDTGPGNVLMDLWAGQHLGQRYDAQGSWAASGRVSPTLLADLQQDSFFQINGPRSTGRDHFNPGWLQAALGQHAHLPPADVQACLCELSAWSIVRTLNAPTDKLVVCGGGVFNQALMTRLAELLPDTPVVPSDSLGIPAMEVEAAAFAWLASQTVGGHASSLVQVTGACAPRILGAIYPA
jgi:anhydro-N-acetylmuramic acid kinase